MRDPLELKAWVAGVLAAQPNDGALTGLQVPASPGFGFDLIAGDASPRKYYRIAWPSVEGGAAKSLMAVDAPRSEKTPEFLHIRGLFETAGVRVPKLIAADPDAGFLLLEDLGDDTLLPILNERSVAPWYAAALKTLGRLGDIPITSAGLVHYDGSKLQAEMDLFRHWFVPQLLGLPWSEKLDSVFSGLCSHLIDSASEQPQIVVHRDFHSRNLMVLENGALAVIDFQDAVVGPVTYDPVSLLKDCYVQWSRQQQMSWLFEHKRQLIGHQRMPPVDDATFLRWFDLMGLQRHLKVLGIFARLCLRDGKSAYLDDLPLVLAYVLEALQLYAPTSSAVADFEAVFHYDVLPTCTMQPWYQQAATS